MNQLALPFPDAIVAALISRDTPINRYEGGLPEYVTVATPEQLQQALELLPPELRGRRVVIAWELSKRMRGKE